MSEEKVVRSITPKPDEEMTSVIMRLKNNPDFIKFRDVLIAGRASTLAFLSTAPAFDERQCHFVQGRVHELADMERMINNIEATYRAYEEGKKQGGI